LDEPTCSRRDAASVVFNLPGYDIIDAVDLLLGGRRVVVQAVERDEGCPDCGVISTRVHAWVKQRVRDIPAGGDVVEVVVRKPRMVCAEDRCWRKTFTQATEQLPARARCLARLREHLADAVLDSGRAVEEVAASYGVAWWTVQDAVDAAVVELPEVDTLRVGHLGVDEHRFARARFFRDDTGGWRRVEPWMSTFVNTDTGQVLGIVDGRNCTGIQGWLDARTPAWRDRIEVVAIDPSATFRSALETALPATRISVDHWHLVRLANLMVTKVRQRVAQETKGHRGRKDDLAWAHRMLLLRAGDRLSERAVHRLDRVFAHDDLPHRRDRRRLGRQGTRPDAARVHRPRRRGHRPRPARRHGACRRHARDLAAVGDHQRLVGRDRDLHRNQSHERPDRGREHRHQAHQAHRTWLPQPLPAPYPATQPPADTPAAHTLESAGHRGQLRIACNRHPTRLARFPTGFTYSDIGI
jgi:transposase